MIKNSVIFSIILFFICFCTTNTTTKNKQSQKEKKVVYKDTNQQNNCKQIIKLDNIFSNIYPYILRITSTGIYVGDGKYIYKFNKNGTLIKKIKLPKNIFEYIDFNVCDYGQKNFFYITWNGLLTCFNIDGKVIFQTGCGDFVKVDNEGNSFTTIQEFDSINNQISNKIKKIDFEGNSKFYQSNMDLGCLNLEIINSKIMFISPDFIFYNIPNTLNSSNEIRFKINEIDERVWFIGKSKKYYVFKTFDFNHRKDMLYFYDENLKYINKKMVNFLFSDIIDNQRLDEDFLMENPSANIYSYYNDNIYILRSTKSGSYVYKFE